MESTSFVLRNVIQVALLFFTSMALADTKIYFVHSDHLGTPQVVTGENQEVVWQGEYDPFGNLVSETGTIEQPIRFPGQYADSETGYYYNYYRDYDPALGRYIQSDPIGLAGGVNTYLYAMNRPTVEVDPLGLWSFSFSAYAGFGGGITFGKHNKTGQWFWGGQIGIGLGGGAGLDIASNGPFDRDLSNNPYGDECEPFSPGNSGTSVGSYAGLGASAGPLDYGVNAQGGIHFDGTGGSYSDGPRIGPGFNPFGGAGLNVGGAFGVQVLGW